MGEEDTRIDQDEWRPCDSSRYPLPPPIFTRPKLLAPNARDTGWPASPLAVHGLSLQQPSPEPPQVPQASLVQVPPMVGQVLPAADIVHGPAIPASLGKW